MKEFALIAESTENEKRRGLIDGIPTITNAYVVGLYHFYLDFNDVSFYFEDRDKEQFYLNICKSLFVNSRIEKVFCLEGKESVIQEAIKNKKNKGKIFIVDLDFDGICRRKKRIKNLFYLNRYSIENYLITKEAVYEVIRCRYPKYKDSEIDKKINFNQINLEAYSCLKEFACLSLIVQKKRLRVRYRELSFPQDFNEKERNKKLSLYYGEVEGFLKKKCVKFSLGDFVKENEVHFKSGEKCLINIPGKEILKYWHRHLLKLKLINQPCPESFAYLLSKDFSAHELKYLREKITRYLNL